MLSCFYYCKILTWKKLNQEPEVREGDLHWSNESYCLPEFPFLLFPCSWFFFRQMFDLFSPPPPPASVPSILPVLDFGRLRATIRASVYGAGHMARDAKQQLHGNLERSPPQGHGAEGSACPPRWDTGACHHLIYDHARTDRAPLMQTNARAAAKHQSCRKNIHFAEHQGHGNVSGFCLLPETSCKFLKTRREMSQSHPEAYSALNASSRSALG